jgi:prevent-host-death family protein
MRTASITQVKNRLSAFLDMVRHGETVLITDRGQPVARLAPLEPGTKEFEDARIARLIRKGVVRPPLEPPGPLPPPVKLPPGVDVVKTLLDERRRGR